MNLVCKEGKRASSPRTTRKPHAGNIHVNSRAGWNIHINFDVWYAHAGHPGFDSGASCLHASHFCLSPSELSLFSGRDGLDSSESALHSGRARLKPGHTCCPTARRDFIV